MWLLLTLFVIVVGSVPVTLVLGERAIEFLSIVAPFLLYGVTLGWATYITNKHHLDLRHMFKPVRKEDHVWKKCGFTILHFTFSISVISFFMYLLSKVNGDWMKMIFQQDMPSQSLLAVSITFVMVVVVAPFVEELLFRGMLLQKLIGKWDVTPAILVSSAIFSILHMNGGFIGHFTLAVFLSIFYLQTKNLWIPIICHSVNNFIAGVGMFFEDDSAPVDYSQSIQDLQQQGPYFGVYALFIFIFLTWYGLKKITQLKKGQTPNA